MYQQRIDRVLSLMAQKGLSQLLISDPQSIWYLTGYYVEPYERLLVFCLRSDGRHTLFLNKLYPVPETEHEMVWFTDTDDSIALIAGRIDPTGPIGIDKLWPARFLLPLMERCPQLRPVLASDCVDCCRACKDETERQLMRTASLINDAVMEKAAAFVKSGVTEKEVAALIEAEYRAAGCSSPSFSSIVSFGAHASDPHHEPDDTVVQPGDCVLIDMGCCKDHYCSDMTRTFFFQSADPEQTAIHDLVRRANEAAETLVRPGVPLCELDAAARNLITEAGYGDYFTHRLGHFIGQADHEQGDVSSANQDPAQEGMIFSIEPGIYLPGRFGVRVEDLVLVTHDGCEVLNQVDKHWRILG